MASRLAYFRRQLFERLLFHNRVQITWDPPEVELYDTADSVYHRAFFLGWGGHDDIVWSRYLGPSCGKVCSIPTMNVPSLNLSSLC